MDNQAQGKCYALIVGIGEYASGLSPIGNTVNDANDIYALLIDHQHGGIPSSQAHKLTDSQATSQGINNELKWLARVTENTPADKVFIFFSCHGLREIGGRDANSYLCPYDFDTTNLPRLGYSSSDLQKSLSAINSRQMLVFLDCCYAGTTVAGAAPNGTVGGLSVDYYKALVSDGGRALLASSTGSEQSYIMANARNSLFTSCLLEVFSGRGVPRTQDAIYVSNVVGYVSRQVTARNPNQHPYYNSSGTDFAVLPNPLYDAAATNTDPVPAPTQTGPAQPPELGKSADQPTNPSGVTIVINGNISSNGGNTAVGTNITQNSSTSSQTLPSNPPSQPASLNLFTLNQKLAGSLDELSMRNICEYINATATFRVGASYDDLHGDGPSARIHSLITFCQQRKVLTLLIDGINTVRPDLLGNSYSQWQSWAAIQDAK